MHQPLQRFVYMLLSVSSALLLLMAVPSGAQTVTPSYYVTASGSCNVIPFSPSTSTTFQVWQGFFAPGMFSGAYAGNISKIYFKYCNTNSGTTYSNFQVQIATSSATSFSTSAWSVSYTHLRAHET